MKKYLLIIILSLSPSFYCQKVTEIFVASWNVENLFDTQDDPQKDDNEFLPESKKMWTNERLEEKYKNLAKVISVMNDGNGPDILGLQEVENQSVLDSLIKKHFTQKNYKIAHAESPDNRGIDVSLIFDGDKFSLLDSKADTVHLDDGYPTRLILNANLLCNSDDTLHVFVNHWPSRQGGEEKSEINRLTAANVLRKEVDHYLDLDSNCDILILGDFNDEPENKSLSAVLLAGQSNCGKNEYPGNNNLVNLAYEKSLQNEGTYFYRGNWNMLDNIIISGRLAERYICDSFEIFQPEFMKTRSGKFKGAAFPTYGSGNRYLGGYSDHYPVTARFVIGK